MLNRTITGIYEDSLRPLGVTAAQLNVLVAVAKAGPVAPGTIARRMAMEKSTLSRNVDRMRQHGWIRIQDGDSARSHKLAISRKGRTLLERALPLWEEAQERAKKLLGADGARSVLAVGNSLWSRQADE
ncbi:MAG: MarR family transcriptional regulator [Planctomycetota bacterium]